MNSIFRETLAACLRLVANALDGDAAPVDKRRRKSAVEKVAAFDAGREKARLRKRRQREREKQK